VSWFYDMGNVFQTGNKVKFLGFDDTTPVNYHFDYANPEKIDRGSRCSGLHPWVCSVSHTASPLNAFSGNTVRFNDRNRALSIFYRSSILTRSLFEVLNINMSTFNRSIPLLAFLRVRGS